jgi:phage terminase small subunit
MNAKQQRFVTEYLVDQNGTQAAKRAGYPGSYDALANRAYLLLKKDEIKSAIEKGLHAQNDAVIRRATISKEAWLNRLHAIAFSDIGDAFQPDANGKLTMTIQQMKSSGFSKLIRKMKVLPGGKVEVDLHSVMPALELIGKTFGWVKDHVEHSGAIGEPITLDQDQFKTIFGDAKSQEAALMLAEKIAPPAGRPAEGEKA